MMARLSMSLKQMHSGGINCARMLPLSFTLAFLVDRSLFDLDTMEEIGSTCKVQ